VAHRRQVARLEQRRRAEIGEPQQRPQQHQRRQRPAQARQRGGIAGVALMRSAAAAGCRPPGRLRAREGGGEPASGSPPSAA
jgi:hypothetical protein